MSSNCYLIRDRQIALIDAGMDAMRILEKINDLDIGIDLLINTHCHYDHIAGNLKIIEETGAKVLVHEIDAEIMESGDASRILTDLFSQKSIEIKVDVKLQDGQKISLGDIELEVIHTPGHTKGSICLYESKSKSLFSGDTVFASGIGRTDLPGGNWDDLKKSIEKLIEFHKDRGIDKIYPGHGPIEFGENLEKIYKIYF